MRPTTFGGFRSLQAGVEEVVVVLLVFLALREAVRVRPARTPGLEEVLHADADLAFHAADRLLQHAGEHQVGCLDLDGILEAPVMVEDGGVSFVDLGLNAHTTQANRLNGWGAPARAEV